MSSVSKRAKSKSGRGIYIVFLATCCTAAAVILSLLFLAFNHHVNGNAIPPSLSVNTLSKRLSQASAHEQHANKIDIVYTWVNGSDPYFLQELQQYASLDPKAQKGQASKQGASQNRYRDNDELRYSIRSLFQFFNPHIRHIYLITNGQVPYWLNLTHPLLTVVTHEDIFPSASLLPVFSPVPIEMNIHRIPGLSKRFLYFNDDMLLGNHADLGDFMSNDALHIYGGPVIPGCNPKCHDHMMGDGVCQADCNTTLCSHDEGDCVQDTSQKKKLKGMREIEVLGPYGNSMKFITRILSKKFGRRTHQLIDHVPYFCDVDIMQSFQDTFPTLFNNSMHKKFRSTKDVIPSHNYFHFVASQPNTYKSKMVESSFRDSNVAFTMLKDELAPHQLRNHFNLLRDKKPKFICLNDDMVNPSDHLLAQIRSFYADYFPSPSPLEITDPNAYNTVSRLPSSLPSSNSSSPSLLQTMQSLLVSHALFLSVLAACTAGFSYVVFSRASLNPSSSISRPRGKQPSMVKSD